MQRIHVAQLELFFSVYIVKALSFSIHQLQLFSINQACVGKALVKYNIYYTISVVK